MSGGRTYWWAKDAAWIDREDIVELGEEHGPAGPLVLDVLCGMAKLENDGGQFVTGFRSLARKVFVDADQVRAIVDHAVRIGALDDFELREDGRKFTARISGWQADQAKGRAAQRKADQRDRQDVDGTDRDEPSGTVTERDEAGQGGTESRSVTGGHAPVGTGQHRTAQHKNNTPQPPEGEPSGSNVVKVKFGGRVVPAERLEAAKRLLEHFNVRLGVSYGPLRGDGKPSDSLSRILRAMTQDAVTEEEGRRLIDHFAEHRFGEGAPSTGQVFSSAMVEKGRASLAGGGGGSSSVPSAQAFLAGLQPKEAS